MEAHGKGSLGVWLVSSFDEDPFKLPTIGQKKCYQLIQETLDDVWEMQAPINLNTMHYFVEEKKSPISLGNASQQLQVKSVLIVTFLWRRFFTTH